MERDELFSAIIMNDVDRLKNLVDSEINRNSEDLLDIIALNYKESTFLELFFDNSYLKIEINGQIIKLTGKEPIFEHLLSLDFKLKTEPFKLESVIKTIKSHFDRLGKIRLKVFSRVEKLIEKYYQNGNEWTNSLIFEIQDFTGFNLTERAISRLDDKRNLLYYTYEKYRYSGDKYVSRTSGKVTIGKIIQPNSFWSKPRISIFYILFKQNVHFERKELVNCPHQ